MTLTFLPIAVVGQGLKANLFLRAPQIVNYNIDQRELAYNPVMSIGAGFSYQSMFIELATLINDDDIYGFYSFFGTTLVTKELGQNLNLHTNWFGEVTYIPDQPSANKSLIYTTGICFFLNQNFDWGSIGFPICIGGAYSDDYFSLNTRVIFNISLNLN